MKRFILFAMVFMGASVAFGADYPDDLTRWFSVLPPEVNSDAGMAANWSQHEWKVYLDKEEVYVKAHDPRGPVGAPTNPTDADRSGGGFGVGWLWWTEVVVFRSYS